MPGKKVPEYCSCLRPPVRELLEQRSNVSRHKNTLFMLFILLFSGKFLNMEFLQFFIAQVFLLNVWYIVQWAVVYNLVLLSNILSIIAIFVSVDTNCKCKMVWECEHYIIKPAESMMINNIKYIITAFWEKWWPYNKQHEAAFSCFYSFLWTSHYSFMEYCVQRLQVIHVQYKKIAQTWHICFLMWMVVMKNFQKASQYYISLSGMWFIFLMNQHDIALIDDPCHQKINCYIKCCALFWWWIA